MVGVASCDRCHKLRQMTSPHPPTSTPNPLATHRECPHAHHSALPVCPPLQVIMKVFMQQPSSSQRAVPAAAAPGVAVPRPAPRAAPLRAAAAAAPAAPTAREGPIIMNGQVRHHHCCELEPTNAPSSWADRCDIITVVSCCPGALEPTNALSSVNRQVWHRHCCKLLP